MTPRNLTSTSTPMARPAQQLYRCLTIACSLFLLAATAGRAQAPFVRTIIVNSGGTPTANGTALTNALAGITTNSSTNPWLLKVEPGIFDLGTGSLTMKDYVDLEGSGPLVTTITSAQQRGSGNVAVINVPSGVHTELRQLTVQNTSSNAIALAYVSSNPTFDHVNLVIPNGAVSTMGILGNGNPTIASVTMQLTSSNNTSQGIYVVGNPVIKDITIAMQNTGAVVDSYGILLAGGNASIDRAVVTVSGAQSNFGIYSITTTTTVTNSRFTATAGTNSGSGATDGIRCHGSLCTLESVTISVTGGADSHGIALDVGGSVPSAVRRSAISASGATNQNNGVYVDDLTSASLRYLEVQATGGTGGSGSQVAAVFADYANGFGSGETLTIADSTLQASGGSTNYGIDVSGASNTFTIVRTSSAASTGTSYGLFDISPPNTYTIDHSQISGGTESVHVNSAFSVGASQLAGVVLASGGTCVDSYNGSYTALSSTCH